LALGWADRVLGGTFGLVKAILIASLLLVPLTTFLPKESSLIRDSVLTPYVMTISEKIVVIVPKEMKKKFADNIKPLKEAWKKP
jgi:membrane protein required for colicin V production